MKLKNSKDRYMLMDQLKQLMSGSDIKYNIACATWIGSFSVLLTMKSFLDVH